MVELIEHPNDLVVRADKYELSYHDDRLGYVRLAMRGNFVTWFPLAFRCHTIAGTDVPGSFGTLKTERDPEGFVLTASGFSDMWLDKRVRLYCRSDRIECEIEVRGRQTGITDLEFFTGTEPSVEEAFDGLFNPEPNADGKQFLPPTERSQIGLRSDPTYHRGNWFFSPGPFYYALRAKTGTWIGVGVAARPLENSFSSFTYDGEHGPAFTLRYEGGKSVTGVWRSPRLVLRPAENPFKGLAEYCEWLRLEGYTPRPIVRHERWWYEPIFCGWGEQVNQVENAYNIGTACQDAAELASQAAYDRSLLHLERHGVHPGTVVIDDKWQSSYGGLLVNGRKWPDLPAFIKAQHDKGRRVLLWLKAWDGEGLPPNEQLLSPEDGLVWAEVSNPAYQRRLRERIQFLLRDCDADGFKIDFTHKAPPPAALARTAGPYGLELLHSYMASIYNAAKDAKYDALIMAQVAHPYFADVIDMLRLNDIGTNGTPSSYVEPMIHRARVARSVWPGWLVDTDNWPSPGRAAWREYVSMQSDIGIPALYYATGIRYLNDERVISDEAFELDDYRTVITAWDRYRAALRAALDRSRRHD